MGQVLRNKPSVEFAFVTSFVMCLFQERLLVTVIPRSTSLSTRINSADPRWYFNTIGCLRRDIVRALHLDVLKLMLDSLLQSSTYDKASCRLSQSWRDVIAVYSFVSSAYSPVEVVGGITSGRSLMNRRKIRCIRCISY